MKIKLTICAMALLASYQLAHATDFSKPMLGLDGKPMMDGTTPATLGTLSAKALWLSYPDEKDVPGDEKYKRGLLGQRLFGAKGEVTLSVEELAMVKKLVAKAYGPLVVVQAWQMLDPGSIPGPGTVTPKP